MVASRLGQADNAGSTSALFLKQFAGEVLTAFQERNVFGNRHVVRTITSGLSAQFPATWKGTAGYHTPGTQLVGTQLATNERVITIDDSLVADRFIAQIDEAKNHYDVRSIYSRDIGMALARAWDKNVAQVALLAARATSTVAGGNGGTVLTVPTAITNADALVAAIFDAAQALDEKDVPEEDRQVFLKPDQYYLLINSGSKTINTDFNGGENNGSIKSGKIYSIAGMEIVKTNNLPQSNIVAGPAAYQGNFSTTAALVTQKGAVGTVKLLDLAMEMEYLIEYQGTLMIGKYAVGHGICRPECAVEIKTA